MKSLAEMDARVSDGKKLGEALGGAGMKKMAELEASCISSSQSNLFQFNPKISYPPDEWVKSDSFWKPKPARSCGSGSGGQACAVARPCDGFAAPLKLTTEIRSGPPFIT